ncbi:uncharacterized protein LOC120344615 isoform X2 [Styela clava]
MIFKLLGKGSRGEPKLVIELRHPRFTTWLTTVWINAAQRNTDHRLEKTHLQTCEDSRLTGVRSTNDFTACNGWMTSLRQCQCRKDVVGAVLVPLKYLMIQLCPLQQHVV